MARKERPRAQFPAGDGGEDSTAALFGSIETGMARLAPEDADFVCAYLACDRKNLRRRAAGALATAIASGDVPSRVCEVLLESDSRHTRWGAAFALSRGGLESPPIVEVAVHSLEDEDGDVRWAAATIVVAAARESIALRQRLHALAKSGSAPARKMALLCLGGVGEKDRSVYLAGLADADSFVRLAAMTALGRIGDASFETVRALSETAKSDVEASVRRAATAILRRLGTLAAAK